jgi:hypothetical protein
MTKLKDNFSEEELSLFEDCIVIYEKGAIKGVNIPLGGATELNEKKFLQHEKILRLFEKKKGFLSACCAEDFEEEGVKVLRVDDQFLTRVREATSRIITPSQTSAGNAEVLMMNAMWWYHAVDALGPGASGHVMATMQHELGPAKLGLLDAMLDSQNVQTFGRAWRRSGFARLDVPHKLAAGLMLTDAPKYTKMPWEAVSISVPDGLCEPIRRLWVIEQKDGGGEYPYVVSAVAANGIITGTRNNRLIEDLTDERAQLLECYVRGVLLCVTDAKSCHAGKHGRSSSKGKRSGPVAGELYRIGDTIEIDFRSAVQEVWSGEKREGPKVQFVVRGHWRNQACGPGRSERRETWIRPFWKGDSEMRVLLRRHGLKDVST